MVLDLVPENNGNLLSFIVNQRNNVIDGTLSEDAAASIIR